MSAAHRDAASGGSILRQPMAVWATAFAAVVAFMGIGLVDPILPSIAKGLEASPSQVSLLFTSYFLITAVAMLVTGFVSSRIGGRRTLLLGLALVVVFAALSGTSDSVGELVGFRAGWGLGNALFVSTSLAVIVGAASGGSAAAILLYESALGLGMSCGLLLGAVLGDASWRYPSYGTAALMAVGFAAITVLLKEQPKPAAKVGLLDPVKALGHKGLAATAGSAFFYNYGFFTVLAFTLVRAGHEPVQVRRGVLLLGRAAGAVLGARRAAAAGQVRLGERRGGQPGAVRGGPRGHRVRVQAGDRDVRHRFGSLHRDQQHGVHRNGSGGVGCAASRRLGRVQLRALVRRGGRAVLRPEARGALRRACAVPRRDRRVCRRRGRPGRHPARPHPGGERRTRRRNVDPDARRGPPVARPPSTQIRKKQPCTSASSSPSTPPPRPRTCSRP
ncbi:MFS transporter [Yinghuangia aomiensis]